MLVGCVLYKKLLMMLLCFVCVGFGGQEPGKSEKVASARVWVTVSYWLWKCG